MRNMNDYLRKIEMEKYEKEMGKSFLMVDFEHEVKSKITMAKLRVGKYAYAGLEIQMKRKGIYEAVKEMVYTFAHSHIYVDYGDFYLNDAMDLLVENLVVDPKYASLFEDDEVYACFRVLGHDKAAFHQVEAA